MTRTVALALAALSLGAACHTPAYVQAYSAARAQAKGHCAAAPPMQVWAAGREQFLVSGRCNSLFGGRGKGGQVVLTRVSSQLTYACRAGDCTLIENTVNDWPLHQPPQSKPAAPPQSKPAAPPHSPLAELVRAQLDARATAILACAGGQPVAVEVHIERGQVTVGVRGPLAGGPTEDCVRAAARLELPEDSPADLTVIHALAP